MREESQAKRSSVYGTGSQRSGSQPWSLLVSLGLAIGLLASACSSPATDDASVVAPSSSQDSETSSDDNSELASSDPASSDTASSDTGSGSSAGSQTSDGIRAEPVAYGGPADLEPVVVAFMYPDLSLAVQFGFAEDLGEFDPVFEAFIAEANERGGIAGHPIEYVPVEFDLFVDGDSTRACLTATQDHDAFLVVGVGGVFGDPIVCVTEQNETLMIVQDGSPEEFYDRADGRLFTLMPSKADTQVAIVDAFREQLEAETFAVFSILDTGGDRETTEAQLLPALQERGLTPAIDIVLDSDGEIAASQIPVLVQDVQDKGVTTMISTGGFFSTAPFAKALHQAGVDVTWIGSDAAGFASDLYARQMEPEQLDGSQAVTVSQLGWIGAGQEEPSLSQACRIKAAGLLGVEMPSGSVQTAAAFLGCNFTNILVAAGEYIEGDLTEASMQSGLESLSSIELADFGPAGFSPTDHTAADGAREVTWTQDCACWSATGEFELLYAE